MDVVSSCITDFFNNSRNISIVYVCQSGSNFNAVSYTHLEQVKKRAKQPVIMKLSPNVTDITVMAKAAEAGGADALSMIKMCIRDRYRPYSCGNGFVEIQRTSF